MKFFRCEKCGNIITHINSSGIKVVCCGEKMKELIPGVVDAAAEKHVPVVTTEGNTVNVIIGSVEHPMTEEHYIKWIALKTKQGMQLKYLTPADAPKASFAICSDDEVEEVYEYCNLHGLWKA